MKRPNPQSQRGLTLLELMLALSITVMVAGAVAGMLGAVTSGVGARRDNRGVMIRANAAQARLAAYVATAECALNVTSDSLVLWLDDSRESETVHATEVRWLMFDAETGELNVHFVAFPGDWSQAAMDLEDLEYPLESDWNVVYAAYASQGFMATLPLVDGLDGVELAADNVNAPAARHFTWTLDFSALDGSVPVAASATIRALHAPES